MDSYFWSLFLTSTCSLLIKRLLWETEVSGWTFQRHFRLPITRWVNLGDLPFPIKSGANYRPRQQPGPLPSEGPCARQQWIHSQVSDQQKLRDNACLTWFYVQRDLILRSREVIAGSDSSHSGRSLPLNCGYFPSIRMHARDNGHCGWPLVKQHSEDSSASPEELPEWCSLKTQRPWLHKSVSVLGTLYVWRVGDKLHGSSRTCCFGESQGGPIIWGMKIFLFSGDS